MSLCAAAQAPMAGCDSHDSPKSGEAAISACRSCDVARIMNTWCDRCGVGYIAGAAIPSRPLFDALDAHGHDVVPELISCETCRPLIVTGGYCERCRFGWVNGMAYLSRLTYYIARGEPRDLRGLPCRTCRANTQKHGWCAACNRGMVGNVAIHRREDFDGACRAYDLMLASLAELPRCEYCALCIQTDFECYKCRIAWKDGRPAKPTGP